MIESDDTRLALEVESLEIDAWSRMLGALPAEHRSRLGLEVIHEGRVTSFVTPGSDTASVNRTLGLGLGEMLTPQRLEHVAARYDAAGVSRWMLQWTPGALPPSAPELFLARGARLTLPMLKLWAPSSELVTATTPSSLRVVEIGAEDVTTFEATVASPLGVATELTGIVRATACHDGWHHYLVLDDARPIAGAAMYVRGEGAWFALGATATADRGRGAQTALLAQRARDAVKLGCTWACAETAPDTADRPNPSLRNMRRAGMKVLYERANYVFTLGSILSIKGSESLNRSTTLTP